MSRTLCCVVLTVFDSLRERTTHDVSFVFIENTVQVTLPLASLGMREFILSVSAESSAQGVNSVHVSRLQAFVPYIRGASKQNGRMDMESAVEIGRSGVCLS